MVLLHTSAQWYSAPVRFRDPGQPSGDGEWAEGVRHLALGRCAQAEAIFRRATEAPGPGAEAWSHLGMALVGLDRSDEAASCFERSLALDPAQAGLWSNLGMVRYHAGDPEAALAAFEQALVRQPDLLPALRNACLALYALGRVAEAEAVLPPSADRCILQGQALREQGDLEGAIDACREAIRLEEAAGSAASAAVAVFSQAEARRALLDAQDRLDGAGLPCFLLAGTLLGVVRDGDLLPHDKDLDLGLPWDVDRRRLVDALCADGTFTLPWFQGVLPPQRPWYRSFVHGGTGTSLDTFFLKPDGDGFLCGFDQRPLPVLSRVRRFGLRDWSWGGRSWRVPDPPERYLAEIYGAGWREPDPHWDTVLSNPVRQAESLPVVVSLGYVRIHEALQQGRRARAGRLAAQVLAHRRDDFLAGLRDRLSGVAAGERG